MAELVLDINDRVIGVIEKSGFTPKQFFKNIIDYISEVGVLPSPFGSDWEPNEETKRAIIEGRADFEAGRLKGYTDLSEMIKDIENWNEE